MLVRSAFTSRDQLDGVAGTPTVANPFHYADNDPLNKTDPLGLRPGDGSITDGQAGAACDSVGGRIVWWGDTGTKVCMEPPIGRVEGGDCFPPITPGGDALVYHQGNCGVWNTTIECARGDWIPGANYICQHAEGITQALWVVVAVAGGFAVGAGAVVAIGGAAGVAIPTGGGVLALASGGTLAGTGAIVLSPTAAGTLVGSVAGIETLIHMASSNSGGGSGNVPNRAHQQKQFEDAWRECQGQVGTLTRAQRRILHDAITKQGFGYHEILAECIDLFG